MSKGNVEFTKGRSPDEVKYARRPTPSKYESLVEEARRLRHKGMIEVPVAEGDDIENARLRVRQALTRAIPAEVKLIKRFVVRKTVDNTIAVIAIHLSRE